MTQYLDRSGWALAYDDTGGPPPALVLCHALGADRSMWDPQIDRLASLRRLVRFDHRGHGESGTPPAPYAIADLAGDVVSLADHLGSDRFDFGGISMGGLVGLWLAVHRPDRLDRLVLANTGASIGTKEAWEERMAQVRRGGMEAIADVVVERFYSPGWREAHPRETAQARRTLLAIDPEGYIGCCAAIRDADLAGSLASIRAMTLVIGGSLDVSTPPAVQRSLADALPNAELLILDAAHLTNVERPEEFTTAVSRFLAG